MRTGLILVEGEQITDEDGGTAQPRTEGGRKGAPLLYTKKRLVRLVYSRDGACPRPCGVACPRPCSSYPVLVPMPLSRSFSLRFALVGSLYLWRIARESAVVGGAREI